MSEVDAFVGEIRVFGGNYAPRSWAFCMGQTMAISQFQTLYAVIGNIYGGNGQTSFNLPDFRGRSAMHAGNGPGLTPRPLGQMGGQNVSMITSNNVPPHTHTANAVNAPGDVGLPGQDNMLALGQKISGPAAKRPQNQYAPATSATVELAPGAVGQTGQSNMQVDNYQPYQVCNFIICLDGIFPPRS